MLWPVQPFRGTRGDDAFGSGHFGASRGGRPHKGLDCVAHPGDLVVSPCEAVVTHVGIAYPGATLGSLHLHATDSRTFCKILYASPQVREGQLVQAGQVIGFAQDVAAYHEKKAGCSGMQNHCHLEVRVDGVLVDPMPLLEKTS
jgi:murein DD-endopeptidase MepM/ murein hydrolase activator NlpD